MQKLVILILILFTVTGCVRKMPIEQGNILTPEMVSQLHTGMTIDEVKAIMGTPVLINTFNNNRVDYVYTMKPPHQPLAEKYVTLIFSGNRLVKTRGNMYSQVMQ